MKAYNVTDISCDDNYTLTLHMAGGVDGITIPLNDMTLENFNLLKSRVAWWDITKTYTQNLTLYPHDSAPNEYIIFTALILREIYLSSIAP